MNAAHTPTTSTGSVTPRVGRLWVWLRSHAMLADATLALVLLGSGLLFSKIAIEAFAIDPSEPKPSMLTAAAGIGAMTIALAFRRRAPLTVLLVSTAGFVTQGLTMGYAREPAITLIALLLAIYSAAVHGQPGRRNWVCAICLTAVVATSLHNLNVGPTDLPLLYQLPVLLVNGALFAAIWALGAALGSGRRRIDELQQRVREPGNLSIRVGG